MVGQTPATVLYAEQKISADTHLQGEGGKVDAHSWKQASEQDFLLPLRLTELGSPTNGVFFVTVDGKQDHGLWHEKIQQLVAIVG